MKKNFKKTELIESSNLYLSKIKCVSSKNSWYRLLIKTDINTYVDVLTGKAIPLLEENVKSDGIYLDFPYFLGHFVKDLKPAEKFEDIKLMASTIPFIFSECLSEEDRLNKINNIINKIKNKNKEVIF